MRGNMTVDRNNGHAETGPRLRLRKTVQVERERVRREQWEKRCGDADTGGGDWKVSRVNPITQKETPNNANTACVKSQRRGEWMLAGR